MARKKTPQERLLAAIEEKRRLSLRELGKTDLYGGIATVEDVTAWYDLLSALVKETPPTERVSTLRIIEDEKGRISGVEYVYRVNSANSINGVNSINGERTPALQAGHETVFVIESRIP